MSYDRDAYWRECFEISMSDAGCDHLLKQMTEQQIREVSWGIQGGAENIGQAFYTPDSPTESENDRLKRKLKWERELKVCRECGGSGRLEYSAGPWFCNSPCDVCNQTGKVHPCGDREPA